MRVRMLFAPGDLGDMPWLVDAVDEYTEESNNGLPVSCEQHQKDWPEAREVFVTIPDKAVLALFEPPVVKGEVGT